MVGIRQRRSFNNSSFSIMWNRLLPALILRGKRYSKFIKWYTIERPQYMKTAFLKAPETQEGQPKLTKILQEFYDTGIAFIPVENFEASTKKFLNNIQEIFKKPIQRFSSSPIEDKSVEYFDEKGRNWKYYNAESILSVRLADPRHYLYREMSNIYGDYKGDSPYTLSSAITEFPYLQDVLRNPTTLKLADYANFNDSEPVQIKIERKTYTTKGEKYNEHYIHLDTVDRSTFKSYVYLNDVSKKNGAITFSQKTHHWKLYPRLLKYIHVRGKQFPLEQINKLKIPPLQPVCGKTGTVIGFTGNGVHSAANVEQEQERWTLQCYYYSKTLWATNKK